MLQGLTPLPVIVLVAAGIAGSMVFARPRPVAETLPDFGHAGHLERGVECVDCHVGVAEGSVSAAAGVPSIRICAELCHGEFDAPSRANMDKAAGSRLVQEHVQSGEEIAWPRAYLLPDHVVFSHRRHATLGKIPCARCHGDIAASTALPAAPFGEVLTMDGCIECHEERKVSTDCFACHR